MLLKNSIQKISGDNNEEEIPVPMPNTEVKLLSAEDTYELPCWENRKSPVFLCLFYSRIVEFLNIRFSASLKKGPKREEILF